VTEQLRITEVFHSLQGEGRYTGLPTVFVRLTGCPLRCGYCDTEYAFSGGDWMSLDDIVSTVEQHGANYVTVTGGEPLAQKPVLELMSRLLSKGYNVSLETSGALDISAVDVRVCRVVDLKTPGSGEEKKNLYENIDHLTAHDQVKFVLLDRADFDWSVEVLNRYDLSARCDVLFSPVHGELAPAELAAWILENPCPVRLQIQLHKYLWGEEQGR